ncbi:ABC transporter ATP-binding protein [Rathayibacter iranicus]|uniref:ABC transporter ATP-binding protein n=2 Tax=Rathayibacter iranicus TaxID=59737 RepID=A0AAD1AI17_9MICO|nr:ABC transporter ATP-binding protein [Rathayibacter iranicus]AZZ56756.1 ABC transporter ATP-binding protein [Rathayibacter iranicus]MWV31197.1 ATP-binding cassette domain-containing protein [Rathayibacter iranicus NCPPB 2253 = VKM Ac-1602]PPI43098.1 multidrug ABC transporter ATP-binding protein [Rathayibacter iranicus]PPI58347.1 multidrug ABC transporter ATP-binding protein [Rathayibacter iranicus]PPI69246.1 multidrug ABC transporter ATP-binding protein [Rathayibacter iranicus]
MKSSQHSPAVSVEALRMRYGVKDVLADVTLHVERGQRIAILGPNGAGKSTLIEILEGFRRPSAGRVRVLDADPIGAPAMWRSRIGIVLQVWRDHGTWRVREFLEFVAAAHDAARPGVALPVHDVLLSVGLSDLRDRRLATLSGGQRRRVDVAAALIGRPELVFLDEPTTGFDPEIRASFHELIRTLTPDTTVLWATHDLHEAEAMCDRIVILVRGAVEADGTPDELRDRLGSGTTIRWRTEGRLHTERVDDPAPVLARLSAGGVDLSGLEVRRASLEDAYLSIVAGSENVDAPPALAPTEKETRR